MIDRTHDPREDHWTVANDDARRIVTELRRRAEHRDGWRRFWAGLAEEDRKILIELALSCDN